MKGLVLILTLALIANHISQNYGMALEGHVAHLGRCKCLRQVSGFSGLRQVKRIQVIPRGIHCRRTEIILTLVNKWKYCVHPDTPWVISLLKKLTKRCLEKTARILQASGLSFHMYRFNCIRSSGNFSIPWKKLVVEGRHE